jgi:hypothetical protein
MKKSPQSTDELKAKQQQVHIDRGGDGQGSSSSSDQAVVKEPSSLSYLLCLKPKDAAAKENSQSETHHYNWDACH